MYRIVALMAVLTASVVVAAPAPLPRRQKLDVTMEDLQRMQGEWVVTRHIAAGGKMPGSQMTVIIQRDRIKYLLNGEVRTEWLITLDVTKTPRQFVKKRVAGVVKGDLTMLGIYQFEGDNLTMASAIGERPKDFAAAKASMYYHFMQRKAR